MIEKNKSFFCLRKVTFIRTDSLSSGVDFSLRNLGFGEALPSHVATYRTDMGLPHRDYSVSVGSDPDTETDGIMSPEHAVRLWGRSNTKSGRSSCLSSRANSNLTLTDTEHENTENGRPASTSVHLSMLIWYSALVWTVSSIATRKLKHTISP